MSLLHKSLYMSGGRILFVTFSMLINIVYSRYLGPAGVGQYELIQSTQVIIVTFFALGLGNATIFFINNLKVEVTRVLDIAIKSALVLGCLLCLTFTTVLTFFKGYFGYVSFPVALMFSVGAAFLLGACYFRPVLIARLQAKNSVIVDLAPRCCMFFGGAVLAYWGYLNVETALLLLSFGSFGSCILAMYFLRHDINFKGGFDWKLFLGILNYGIKLSAAGLMYTLAGSIGIILLRFLLANEFEAVGLYARAAGVCGMITLIPEAVTPLLYAKWAGVTGEVRARQGERALRMGIAVSLFCFIGLAIFGRFLITLLYGAAFSNAYYALIVLAPGLLFIVVFNTCNQMLASDGKAIITTYILIISTLVNVITAYLAIPSLSYQGAALATLFGNVTAAVCCLWICVKYYNFEFLRCFIFNRADIAYVKGALSKTGK